MISQRLVRLVEQNAECLIQDLSAELRRDPRTEAYHGMSDEDLHERGLDLFRSLGRWLSGRTEFAIQMRYEALGRRRYRERIPLSQVLCALLLAKVRLLDFLQGSACGEPAELPLEYELAMAVTQFWDKAVYYVARGYEEAARAGAPEALVATVAAGADAARKPLRREAVPEPPDLDDFHVSRSGDIGESGG
jgi:hypothetical protein